MRISVLFGNLVLEVAPCRVSKKEEQGEMWSSRYVAGEAAGAQEEVKCAVLCRGELGSDAAALVCLKRSGCSMDRSLSWPLFQQAQVPHPFPCLTLSPVRGQ